MLHPEAATKHTLPFLPGEVIERIIESLDLASLQNLRLACKRLSEACLGPHFKTFFAKKTTDLSSESIQSLGELVSHPKLGHAVKNITVYAAIHDTSVVERMLTTKRRRIVEQHGMITSISEPQCTEEELAEAQADLDWLRARQQEQQDQTVSSVADAFAGVLRHLGSVDDLDVDARVAQGRKSAGPASAAKEWYQVWLAASRTFSIVTSAIARSQVTVKTLMFFRNTLRCSIQSIDIANHIASLEADGFAEAGARMTDFALSFSPRIPVQFADIVGARAQLNERDQLFHEHFGSTTGLYMGNEPEAVAPENFTGVAAMLKMMPNLDAIDLHMYNTLRGSGPDYVQVFGHVAREVLLSKLEQVFLRGIRTTVEDLLLFLKKHPNIKHLDMRHISLDKDGRWEQVFAHLRDPARMPVLERLRLSSLFEVHTVNLAPAEDDQAPFDHAGHIQKAYSYPCFGGNMVHTREFIGAESIRGRLRFAPRPGGRALGSPYLMIWTRNKEAQYGPP